MTLNKFMAIVVTMALVFITVSMFTAKSEETPKSVLPTANEIQEMMRVQYISKPQTLIGNDGTVRLITPVNCKDEKGWTWDIVDFAAGLKPIQVGDRVYVTKGISIQPDTQILLVHWIRIDYVIKEYKKEN